MIIDIALPLSLAFIMFSLGMGLTTADFRNVLKYPKAFAIGLINQMIVLPIVAFVIIRIFGIGGELAVGLMILSGCPGGVTSNIVTKIARGDVALSISFTAVISIATIITLPLIAGFSVGYFMGAEAPEINIITLGLTMSLLALVPVIIGLLIRHNASAFSKKFEPIAGKISTFLFIFVVVVALVSEWDTFVSNVFVIGPTLIGLLIVMLVIGYSSSKLLKLPEEQASAVAIATGIQNVTMGITIGNIILPSGGALSSFALPSGIYGILMYLICLPIVILYVRVLRKKGIQTTPAA